MSLLSRRPRTEVPPSAPSGYTLLDTQLSLTGDIETAGSVRIDGRIEGSVKRADTVVLGTGATMIGDVHAREVVIGGTITGSVFATERVELQPTAIVTGDVTTQSVLVQEGGVVNGRVVMHPPAPAPENGKKKSSQPVAAEIAPTPQPAR